MLVIILFEISITYRVDQCPVVYVIEIKQFSYS